MNTFCIIIKELEQVIVLAIIVYYVESILGYVVWTIGWFISDELERPNQGTYYPCICLEELHKTQKTSVEKAGIVGTLQIQA